MYFGNINTINHVTVGPTILIPIEGITPFGLATFGINHEEAIGFGQSYGFGFTGGRGFDLHAFKRLDIRLIEAEYLYGHHNFGFVNGSPTAIPHNMGSARASRALLFSLRSIAPAPVPASTPCSAQT